MLCANSTHYTSALAKEFSVRVSLLRVSVAELSEFVTMMVCLTLEDSKPCQVSGSGKSTASLIMLVNEPSKWLIS